MDNNKKSSLINMIGLGVLVLTIAIMSLGLIKKTITGTQANILVGIGLFLFWILSDIVEPYVCERFKDNSFAMREAYVKYIMMDLVGYAGVLYFLTGVGGNGRSSGILGAVIFVVTMKPKRDNMRIFYGLETPDEDEEEEAEEETPAQPEFITAADLNLAKKDPEPEHVETSDEE